jgi:hypothetical protein
VCPWHDEGETFEIAVWFWFGFVRLCAGIRETEFAAQAVWLFCLGAGIRILLACFTRRPCAGRPLLFFAAAKKSRGGFKG